MVHVADKLAQVLDTKILDIDAVNQHFALLYIVVARYQVDECRLTTSALSHNGNRLPLRNHQINVLQHPIPLLSRRGRGGLIRLRSILTPHSTLLTPRRIPKPHVPEFYLVLERGQMLWLLRILNRILCL